MRMMNLMGLLMVASSVGLAQDVEFLAKTDHTILGFGTAVGELSWNSLSALNEATVEVGGHRWAVSLPAHSVSTLVVSEGR